jgi:3-methyladenine DNA glycosylase AlkD
MNPMVTFLRLQMKEAADPEKAGPMKAYMKGLQDFYGVPQPKRKNILQTARNKFPITSFEEYESVLTELWKGRYREELYLAIDIGIGYKKFRIDRAMPLYEKMIKTADNWDTVDLVASRLVGELVLGNRAHEKKLIQWMRSKNFWLRGASLLAHLNHRKETNVSLLEKTILTMIDEQEFFIQKAIGWVLRQYARTDAAWVRKFVKKHQTRLSGLSRREAMKHLQT